MKSRNVKDLKVYPSKGKEPDCVSNAALSYGVNFFCLSDLFDDFLQIGIDSNLRSLSGSLQVAENVLGCVF